MFQFKAHHGIMREGLLVGYESDPYAIISARDQPSVAIQSGRFWNFNGEEMPLEDVPDYAWDIVSTYTEEFKKQVGIEKLVRPASKTAKKAAT